MSGEALRVVSGNARGDRFPIGDEFLIGRGASPEGRLGDDEELSRTHARITRRSGRLIIEDLGSRNGTWVNGERIDAPRTVTPGDVIKVGQTVLEVVDASGRTLQRTTVSRLPDLDDDAPTSSGSASRGAAAASAPVDQPTRDPRRLAVLLGALLVLLVGGGIAAAVARDGDETETASVAQTAADAGSGQLSVPEIVERAAPSTLAITVKGPRLVDDRIKVNRTGGGTGILINPTENLVLTNAHVVVAKTSIKVRLPDGSETNAVPVGRAPCEDLAVIKLRAAPAGLTGARLGSSKDARIGDPVIAVGYPISFEQDIDDRRLKANSGTITATAGKVEGTAWDPEFPAVIEHQAPLNRGHSGGPLYNQRGEVIGVNTFSAAPGRGQNQNAAIAIDRVKALLGDLEEGRNTGYVGWSLIPLRFGGERVLVVEGVAAGSPAKRPQGAREDQHEIGRYDIIDELDDTPVDTVEEVCDIIGSKSSGDPLEVTGRSVNAESLLLDRGNGARFRTTLELE